MLTSDAITGTLAYYRDRLTRYGDTVEAVGWNAENQAKRFALLTQGWDLAGVSVLDVGCGRADLWVWLVQHGWHGSYCGVEVVPEMAALAQMRTGNILVVDAESDDLPACDYAVASGTFNLDLGDFQLRSADMMWTILRKMWQSCQRGMAFDCLDHLRLDRIEGQWYADRSDVMKGIRALTPAGTITRFDTESVAGNLIVQVNKSQSDHKEG